MKITLLFAIIILLANIGYGQIFYSAKIPKPYTKTLKNFESALKHKPFELPKTISDSFHLTAKDSISYSKIFADFFDTASIKNLKGRQTYYMEQSQEEQWLKAMTINSVIGFHNLIKCLPENIFFVTTVAAYTKTDTFDNRFKYSPANLLVAGYHKAQYFYPIISLLFSKETSKISYINLLINFEGYSKEKELFFDENLSSVITSCERKYTDRLGIEFSNPLPNKKNDTTHVIDPRIEKKTISDTSTFVH